MCYNYPDIIYRGTKVKLKQNVKNAIYIGSL